MLTQPEKFAATFNRAALALQATQTAAEFTAQIHKALRALLCGDFLVVDWVDARQSRSISCKIFPEHQIPEELSVFANSLAPSQSPAWLRCAREPRAISDFITHAEWQRRDLHWAYGQIGQKDSMGIDVSLSPTLTLRLRDIRSRFGSYSATERLMLSMLAPHVRQVFGRLTALGDFRAAEEPVRRLAQAPLDASASCRQWPRRVRELLTTYGVPLERGKLGGICLDWFREQTHAPSLTGIRRSLCIQRGERKLQMYLVAGPGNHFRLILQETDIHAAPEHPLAKLGVSGREGEVLRWLSEGKTNHEIATILDVSEGTIRRHLENIYPKLGVENRHCASLVVRQALASQLQGTLSA